jgi:hypothetical protein
MVRHAMSAAPRFDLIDRLLDGKLDDKLRAWRAEDLSFDAIALKLRDEHNVTVSRSWVNRRCDLIGAVKGSDLEAAS